MPTFIFPLGVSDAQKADISFFDGLNVDGSLDAGTAANPSFFAWDGTSTPAVYTGNGIVAKWGGTTAGSAGGAVTYYFDDTSNWTTAEKQTFLGAMGLYSDIANISFTAAANEASAQTVFYRYAAGKIARNGDALQTGYYESGSTTRADNADNSTLGTRTFAYISAETSNPGFGDITSFSTASGYGIGSIVHEMGHLIGLGHTGPYNGNVNAATQQFNAADVRTYSIMSYITPNDTTAANYNKYTLKGTDWNGASTPFTPMLDDILAVQQLYGAATATQLNTTQTFGFNTTITDATRMFYDFTVDTTPILTLYDTAKGNKLDLSGYTANSMVNLNPGTFSSIAGLINNISIAYNTAVDYLIGGAGDDTIITNSDADTIDGGTGNNTVEFAGLRAAYTLARAVGGVTVTNNASNTLYTLTNVAALQFSDVTVQTDTVTCYMRGTHILTERGEIAVEALAVGDLIVVASGALRRIRWIGWRGLDCARHARPEHVWPIRVQRGAFGENLPHRDLWLSPGHAIATDGALVPISALVNGQSVAQVKMGAVEYWHVELDAHDVIFAEGLPAESYLDCGNRTCFTNGGAFIEAHPDFQPRHWAETCLPLVSEGLRVGAAKALLLARLEDQGRFAAVPCDAHVCCDGMRIEPLALSETRLGFALPSGARDITLRSRVFIPAHTVADSAVPRALGLCVGRLQIDGAPLAIDDDAICASGWHEAEGTGDWISHRWTTGATPLPKGARIVIVDLAGVGAYRGESEADEAQLFG